LSITIPGYIQVNDAAGNTVAFLSPEADKIKECWMDRRLNGESTLTFQVPAFSQKLSELDPESRIIAEGREFVILKPDAMDTVRDDAGQTWTKVMAVESWKLLGKTYPTINNDPDYPWPPDRKGDAYNDPDHGWIIPDALVVCIISGGNNLSGGLYQTGTAAHALHVLLKDTGWTLGTVDVTGTYDLETEKESTLANIQEVQKTWGGLLIWEYVFDDNGKIVERKLHLRDEDAWRNYTGFQIRYAKNLKHITRSDNNDIVTRLYPFGENDLDIYAINDGKKYVENYSYTDSILFGVFKDQKIHDQQELKEKAEKALAKMCKPRRTYRIKMADLRTLPEYQHEDFQLGDIVDVIDEDLGINLQARVVRHRHNVFMPWQCELEIGEPEERLVSSLKDSFDIAKYVKETVRPNRGISQIIKGILNTFHTAIQGANGDFDVVDGVATWWETDENGERTGNLVRITPGGILISDDGGQTSQLAITGEGIAAEAVIGTLGMFAKVKADQIIIGSQGEGISEELIAIGPETTFAEGYDPTDNHLYFQYSADGATGWHDTFNPATDKYMRQKVGDDGTWSDPMRVVGEDGQDGYTPVKGTDYFDGVDGLDGTSSYLWVRYSQNANGNPMVTDPTGAKYIGIATTTTASAPTDYTDYSWSLIKGSDGIPGEPGADGQTSYLHIKYSDDGETFTANGGETVGAWIGTYVDFVQEDSTTFSDYTWNKVRGEDGRTPVKGTDYFDGVDGQDGISSYLWIKYSADADGTDFSDTPNTYMGVAVTTTPTAPTLKTAYRWTKVVGTDGIPGEPGADGQTSYLHIKYSDDGVNFTANNGEDVGAWIGTYVDFVQEDSNTFSDYTWNKVKEVKVFTVTPYTPYDIGNIWIKPDGSTMICINKRQTGAFTASDWRDVSENKFDAPGYVLSTPEGMKVFDAGGALRVLVGSWLKDSIRKYGIKILGGEIYSTTFQTGAEDADTYIRLDPDGNFSAYKNGKRIIFMQASASEGRIRLGDGIDNPYKMSLLANYNVGGYSMSLLKGENGLDLSGGVGDFRLLPDGSMQAYLGSGKEFYIQGNHWVTGTKNAAVTTDSYGQRLLYCMEMPEIKFMDEGTGELINGLCRIDIDPIFLETIEPNTTETPFIVHLTPYDWLNLRVKEIGDTYFVIEEKDGLDGKFSWQLSATRKGYAGERMRRVDAEEDLLTSNWEDDLSGFLEQES
jgi:phage minor structural protein